MSASFAQTEVDFLIAWANEDHLGLANGPARSLLRLHGVHPAVAGQLFARLSTLTGRSQFELIDNASLENPIHWPWPAQGEFETRLHELLPECTLHYLEELGVLTASSLAAETP